MADREEVVHADEERNLSQVRGGPVVGNPLARARSVPGGHTLTHPLHPPQSPRPSHWDDGDAG
eukprot:5502894-Lingulodinium_polyedra.AAC.1